MNVQAFLDTIAACEGTEGPDGYSTLFGSSLFQNGFVDHPRIHFPFVDRAGVARTTSAAGRYQFIIATWDRLAHKLWPWVPIPMFSPANQDLAAIELIAEQGAMPFIKEGDFQHALDLCATQWASLPASTVAQPKRSYEFAQNAYRTAGGTFA